MTTPLHPSSANPSPEQPAEKPAGILSGIRVLDFSHQLSGPVATLIMGDMGADVIKVESPGRGDGLRFEGRLPPAVGSPQFWSANRNKRSITLNLKNPDALAVALELARTADVLVENFRPGVMDKLGLSYAAVQQANPEIIYYSVSAFGYSGPMRDLAGVDSILQSVSGLMGITGESNDRTPVKAGYTTADVVSGLWGAIAILLALYHKKATGRGQLVQMAMLDCLVALQMPHMTALLRGEGKEGRFGSVQQTLAPYQAYRGSDGQYFFVACLSNAFWRRLCKAIGREDLLADPRFVDSKGRRTARAELNDVLEPLFMQRPAADWVTSLQAQDVLAQLILMPSQTLELEQLHCNGMVQEMDHPTEGRHKVIANPIKVSPAPELRRHSPMLGEHTEEVLLSLGRSKADIEALKQQGAI